MINIGFVNKGEIAHLKDVDAVFCPAVSVHLLSQMSSRPNMNLLKRQVMSQDDMEDVLMSLSQFTEGDFLYEAVSVEDIQKYLAIGNPIICKLANVDVGNILRLSPFGPSPKISDGDRHFSIVLTSFADGIFYGYVPQRDSIVSIHGDLLSSNYKSIIRTYLKNHDCFLDGIITVSSSGCVSDPSSPDNPSNIDNSPLPPPPLPPIVQIPLFTHRPFLYGMR
jgi:hypothetical protein